ncbi:phage tail tape measure protein [Weissella confusa]|uniref:phage tail tape measure protein n=1 Tax=Weissella confusa TaxID=1583 RepID=UPI0021AF091C|nr:phage tail tape measure protein [Weissella confusa]MCT0009826.1 phage tail tape measure protein [Weissella confusa]
MAGSRIKGITIDIDGNTTGLQSSLKGVNATVSKTSTELRDVNKLLKLDPGNTELVAQKQKLLGNAVEATETKLKALKSAQSQVEAQFKSGDIGEEQYRGFQREVQATEGQLNRLKSGLQSTESYLNGSSDAAGRAEAGFRETKKSVADLDDTMEEVNKGVKFQNIVDGAQAAGDGIKEFASKAMDAWGETDDAVDNLTSKTGATGAAADALAESYEKVVTSMPIDDTQDLSNTMAGLKSQFDVSDKSLASYSEKMMQFSAVTGQSGEEAVTGLHDAMAKFNLGAKDLPSVLDAFTAASQRSGVPVKDLEEQASKAAPTFKEMGVSLQDGVGILASWSKGGVDGATAITGMTKAAVNYAKDGKTLQDGLKETFNTIKNSKEPQDQLNAAVAAFGAKAGPKMLDAIRDGKVSLKDLSESVKESGGALKDTYNQTLDPSDKLKIAQQQLNESLADVGNAMQEVLLPVANAMMPVIKSLAKSFADMPMPVKLIAVGIGAFIVVLGALSPVITAVASVLPLLGVGAGEAAVGTGLLSTSLLPIIGIIAAVIAAIALIVLAFKNWGAIVEWLDTVWATIKVNVQYAIFEIKNTITTVFTAIGSFFSGLWSGIKNVFSTVWNAISSTVSSVANAISSTISNVFNAISSTIRNIVNGIRSTISSVWNGISSTTSSIWNGIRSSISNVVNSIRNTISSVLNSLGGIASGAFNGVRNAASNVLNGALNVVSGIVNRIKGLFNFSLRFPSISIPHIPLPHFSLSGSFNPLKGQIPRIGVNWYAKGGIFTKPTLFAANGGYNGVGEAGPEAALPLNDKTLGGIGKGIVDALGGELGGTQIVIQVNADTTPATINKIRDAVMDGYTRLQAAKARVTGA